MTIDIKQATNELVQDEIRRGHFHSVDEIIVEGVNSRRDKHTAEESRAKPRRHLYELLTQAPLHVLGVEQDVHRELDAQGQSVPTCRRD